VRSFLDAHLPGKGAAARADVAQGSIGVALAESGATARAREAAEGLIAAVLAGGPDPWERALRQSPWQARGEFTEMLDALAELLADAAREQSGGTPRRPLPKALRSATSPARMLAMVEQVQAARESAQGNVNPQLLLAALAGTMEESLCR